MRNVDVSNADEGIVTVADPRNAVRVAERNIAVKWTPTSEFKSYVEQLQNEKCSHMTLRPIPWGKRDQVLGFMVVQNMVDTIPPVVVPWSTKATRMLQRIREEGGLDIKVHDLRTLIPERF